MPEWIYPAMLAVNTLALLITVLKTAWGGSQGLQGQFAALDKSLTVKVDEAKANWSIRHETMSQNIGNVTANLGNRIHDIELKAMEFRAITAENLQQYMRREDYHKAADEFKRDVRDAHDDIKEQMISGFRELREQIEAVSATIETNRQNGRNA